jgi:hypothetical protein
MTNQTSKRNTSPDYCFYLQTNKQKNSTEDLEVDGMTLKRIVKDNGVSV